MTGAIEGLVTGFRLLDTWDLPAEGTIHDFDRLVATFTSFDPLRDGSAASRALFAVRFRLGRLLRWDEGEGVGFRPVLDTDTDWAAEIDNRTVHGILHLAWVDQGDGGYRGRLAVYVKAHGLLGRAYLALIQPFRHVVVYPSLLRHVERTWR